MSSKLFLTGKPGVGKTTLFHKIINQLGDQCHGFYTREIMENNIRTGFEIITINLPIGNGPMAHIDFKTDYQLAEWGVDITHLEKVVEVLQAQPEDQGKILVIDEIAPMEAFSEKFKNYITDKLQSEQTLLATIKQDHFEWTDELKSTFSIPLITVTTENRDSLEKEILDYLS